MRDVFISHVEEDADVALELARGLEEAGYVTWYFERDSLPGLSYLAQTGGAVEDCRAFVLVISPHSLGSNQVTAEVVRAHEGGRPFIPVLRGISHLEFQNRQPVWRQAVGSAASVSLLAHGVGTVVPRIVKGLQIMGIHPEHPPEGHDGTATPPPAKSGILKRLVGATGTPLWRRPIVWAAAAALGLLGLLTVVAVVVAVMLARPGAPTPPRTGATPQPTRAQAAAGPTTAPKPTAAPAQAQPAAAGALAPALTLGTPAKGELQSAGDVKYHQASVAAGEHLTVVLDGADNNAIYELYIRFGSLPNPEAYDAKSTLPNADQAVEIASTQAGTYYVMVRSARWGSEYTIAAYAASTFPAVEMGTPITGNLQSAGDVRYHQVSVAAGEHLTVVLDGADNNAIYELYIRFGALPDIETYDARGTLPNADQAVEIASTQAGTYYLMVRSARWGSEYTIAAHTASTFPAVEMGTPVTGNLQSAGDVKYYQVSASAGEHLLAMLDGADNNAIYELYIRFGALPDLEQYDAKGTVSGADQAVEVANAQEGTYYLMVRSARWGSGFTIAVQK